MSAQGDLLGMSAPPEVPEQAELCEWCLTFSGRTKKGRPCCELRALASMPKAQREPVLMKVWKEDGAPAMERLKAAMVAEYKRRVAFNRAKHGSFVASAKAALLRPSI